MANGVSNNNSPLFKNDAPMIATYFLPLLTYKSSICITILNLPDNKGNIYTIYSLTLMVSQ